MVEVALEYTLSPDSPPVFDAMQLRDAASSPALLARACAMVGAPTGGMVSAYHVDLAGGALVRVAEFGVPPAVEAVTRTLGPQDTNAWRVYEKGEEFRVNLSQPGLGDPDLLGPVIATRSIHAILLPLEVAGRRWGIFTASWTSVPGEALLAQLRQFVQHLSLIDELQISRRKLRRFQMVIDATTGATDVGLLVQRSDGTLITYNPMMEALTGWTRDEVQARGWANLVYPDPETRAQMSSDGRALLSGALAWVDRQITCKNGRQRLLRVMSRTLEVEDETAPWIVGLFQDLQGHHTHASKFTLADFQRAFNAFAAAQSNELTNTLAPIRGHLELLTAETDIGPVVRKRVRNIESAVERGVAMSKRLRLLALPRLTAPGAVDIRAELQALVQALGREGGAPIALSMPDTAPPVAADADSLRQALEELLSHDRVKAPINAVILLDPRLLRIPDRATFVSDGADRGAEHLVVCVAYAGAGLGDDERLRLALPPFLHADQGLGLAVVRAVIDAHCGAIDVQDEGRRVALYLPVSTRAVSRPSPVKNLTARGDELVWAVDDEDDLVEYVGLSLQARGYRVLTFSTSAAVLGAAEDEQVRRPDVLVLDVMLATKRGPDLLRELRRRGVRAPVVWTSGYNADTARVPLDDDKLFLGKPFRGVELATAVRRLLDKRLV